MKETLRVNSLDQNQILESKEIEGVRAIVADIDYTLVDFDTGHKEAIEVLAYAFGTPLSQEINRIFRLILEGHRLPTEIPWVERSEFEHTIERIRSLQSPSAGFYGVKAWSRESWFIIATQNLGMEITPEQVEWGRDAYWAVVGENQQVYKDAQRFLESIQQQNLPLILMTGSDSVLKVNKADDDLALEYNPLYSEEYKRRRLEKLPFSYVDVVIGDPIDKPDPRFFDRVLQRVRKATDIYHMSEILVVGDSERNDLQVPRKRGYTTLLVQRS